MSADTIRMEIAQSPMTNEVNERDILHGTENPAGVHVEVKREVLESSPELSTSNEINERNSHDTYTAAGGYDYVEVKMELPTVDEIYECGILDNANPVGHKPVKEELLTIDETIDQDDDEVEWQIFKTDPNHNTYSVDSTGVAESAVTIEMRDGAVPFKGVDEELDNKFKVDDQQSVELHKSVSATELVETCSMNESQPLKRSARQKARNAIRSQMQYEELTLVDQKDKSSSDTYQSGRKTKKSVKSSSNKKRKYSADTYRNDGKSTNDSVENSLNKEGENSFDTNRNDDKSNDSVDNTSDTAEDDGNDDAQDSSRDDIRIDITQNRHKCHVCLIQFPSGKRFNKHMDTKHPGVRKFKCPICPDLFKRANNLRQHIQSHSDVRKYRCEVCGKAFKRNGDLTEHMRKHSGERPFICEICSRRFMRNTHLHAHRQTHMDPCQRMQTKRYIKVHKCSVCDRAFNRKKDMEEHVMTHTGERPFMCEVCGSTFRRNSHLKQHMPRHTNERKFVCIECGKSFLRSADLHIHLQKHGDSDKMLACSTCALLYQTVEELERHESKHFGEEKSFICIECGDTFPNRLNLEEHKQAEH